MTKYVYDFSEGNKDMKDLLGGKGANLAEMTNMGLPVPHGLHDHDRGLPDVPRRGRRTPPEMLEEVGEHLAALEESMGKTLGDAERSAARQRALGREVLDAGDDGHGPEPRAERRPRSRGSRRRPATTCASRATPTAGSSRCSARS